MKAYIFTNYESDERKHVLEKKVIVSDLGRFEIIKLGMSGSYDWEECGVEFRPERLNPETRCPDGHELEKYEGSTFCDVCKMP